MHKLLIFAALLCVALAQNCTHDWECGNIPYRLCQAGGSECSTTITGIAIDEYPNVYYANICPSGSGSEIIFRSVPLEGGEPTDLYSVSISGTSSSVSILDGLFNSIYFQPSANGPLQRVIGGQVITQSLTRPFGGQLNLEFEPEGQSFVCSSSGGSSGSDEVEITKRNVLGKRQSTPLPTSKPTNAPPTSPHDSVDLYDGLRELYFGFTKSIYILPLDSCGPSRLGPKADGSRSTDLYFTTVASGETNFYLGTTTCLNCDLPTPLFTHDESVSDFDVSTQYIFFGTSSGLYRTDLNGENQVQLTTDTVSGVRVLDEKVYFNAGNSIRSINADGSENTRLDQVSSTQSTCQCRGRFSGSTCSECDGQVQWNDNVPSCVATDENGVPESCTADFHCGNPPFSVCNSGSCACAHESLSGVSCNECVAPSQLAWSNNVPSCL